jgi:acyl CoA:acetate/3-ketoacid CoA transferase alpha subunit
MQDGDMEDFTDITSAAKNLGIDRKALLRKIQRGKVKATKFGWVWMIPQSEMERLRLETTGADN